MKPFLILILFFSFALSSFAQQALPDSGFTNKAEAKNLMVNGLKEGKWCEYMNSQGIIIKDTQNAIYYCLVIYRSGILDGMVHEFNIANGRLEKEAPYSIGRENGIEKRYYPSGKLMMILPITNDKKNGIVKGFSQSGELLGETPVTDGKENGVAKWYYKSGKLKTETPYTDGKRIGIEREYYEGGKLKRETPYTDDQKNGSEKKYYEDGKLQGEAVYINDKWISGKYYEENGEEIKIPPPPPINK